MRWIQPTLATLLVAGGLLFTGCKSPDSAPPATMPSAPAMTMPTTPSMTMPAMTMPAMTMPAMPAMPAVVPDKDMTHTLTKDQPYFTSEPSGPAAAPAGTLPAGSKVLLVIPGATYSQVTTSSGMSVYTMTDGLKSIK